MTACKYGDPFCPCQDGDSCHYEGKNPMRSMTMHEEFEAWATTILGDNQNWRESGDGELARQAWQAGAAAARERIAAWISTQRNDVPATGEEFAAAIRATAEDSSVVQAIRGKD